MNIVGKFSTKLWVLVLLLALTLEGLGCAQTGRQLPVNDEQALRALAEKLPAMEAAEKNLPRTHQASEIRGQVVDGETGAPVVGAAVVAIWTMTVIVGLQYATDRLHIAEGVTDATGTYVIPAWGPKLLPLGAEVTQSAPAIFVLKSGYKTMVVGNESVGPPRDSEWNGKAIKLGRPTGTIEQQASYLSRAYSVLGSSYLQNDPQNWRNFPKATLEAYKEAKRLQPLGVPRWWGLGVLDIEQLDKTDRDFLRRFE
jgi:hypothetical protein